MKRSFLETLFSKFFNVEPFKSRTALLKGTAGIITVQQPCGCILKGEHQPDKHLWIFQYDYSKCKQMKHALGVTK